MKVVVTLAVSCGCQHSSRAGLHRQECVCFRLSDRQIVRVNLALAPQDSSAAV